VTIDLADEGTLVVLDPEVETITFHNTSAAQYSGFSLYLDGNPVPGSLVPCPVVQECEFSGTGGTEIIGQISLPDVSIPNVAAGTHTVTLA
jgi:hypothetical protein